MFNTAPIMEWHNTTLLRYFMDICTFIISPKFYNYGLIQNRGRFIGDFGVGLCHNRRIQKGFINSEQYVLIRVLLVAFGGLLYEYLY